MTTNSNENPSLKDLFDLITDKHIETASELAAIKLQIKDNHSELAAKVEVIESDVAALYATNEDHSQRIDSAEENIELLKQERLKNNLRISGIPASTKLHPVQIVLNIAHKLDVAITNLDFEAYATKGGAFIIAVFYNYAHKCLLLRKMRNKKTLMVEEVFTEVKSNNRIFLNEHLTPYFKDLFQMAWSAKKEGKLFSVMMSNSTLRIKKTNESPTVFILNERVLNNVINYRINTCTTDSEVDNMKVNNNTFSSNNANQELELNADPPQQQGLGNNSQTNKYLKVNLTDVGNQNQQQNYEPSYNNTRSKTGQRQAQSTSINRGKNSNGKRTLGNKSESDQKKTKA